MTLPVLSDSLTSYLAEVNRYPLLTPDEEFEVAERYYRHRRVEDAHTLVTSNLRYVVKIAHEFRDYGVRIQDLIQEGNIGLMVAVKKFNPHKGFKLITYATWWIKAFMQDFIVKTKGLVRRGSKTLKKKLFYKNTEDLPELPSDLSLDAPVSDDSTTYLDMLAEPGPNQEEAITEQDELSKVGGEIQSALSGLDEREKLIIEERVMAEEPKSLQELGNELGLTRERVRQIEGAAFKKLKKALKANPAVLAALPAATG